MHRDLRFKIDCSQCGAKRHVKLDVELKADMWRMSPCYKCGAGPRNGALRAKRRRETFVVPRP